MQSPRNKNLLIYIPLIILVIILLLSGGYLVFSLSKRSEAIALTGQPVVQDLCYSTQSADSTCISPEKETVSTNLIDQLNIVRKTNCQQNLVFIGIEEKDSRIKVSLKEVGTPSFCGDKLQEITLKVNKPVYPFEVDVTVVPYEAYSTEEDIALIKTTSARTICSDMDSSHRCADKQMVADSVILSSPGVLKIIETTNCGMDIIIRSIQSEGNTTVLTLEEKGQIWKCGNKQVELNVEFNQLLTANEIKVVKLNNTGDSELLQIN